MTIPAAWLDQLKARITLSLVIGQTHALTKIGPEHKTLCPFHDDKNPSLTVCDDKGFYHCFTCGAHGDAFDWLEHVGGLTFTQSCERLGARFGLEMPEQSAETRLRAKETDAVYAALAAAAIWFAEQLGERAGAPTRAYLAKRGITATSITDFAIGYAPASSSALRRALARFGDDILVAAGLLINVEGKAPYDRFRDRLMFAIRDARGRVTGFGGRVLGDGTPKYLNSPETAVFDKGRTLYNLDRAAPAVRRSGRFIVVEGYLDVIALVQAGFAGATAPLGTAVTEDHLASLWRHSAQTPLICFDGDSAGQRAALRTAVRALPRLGADCSLDFVALPEGQDPDDLITTKGAAAFAALLAQATPIVSMLWHHEYAAKPLTTPEARAGLRQRLYDHIAHIEDPVVRAHYRADFDQRLREAFQPRALRGAAARTPSAAQRQIAASGVDTALVRAVLAGFLSYPALISVCEQAISRLAIDDNQLEQLRDLLLRSGASGSAGEIVAAVQSANLDALVGDLQRASGLSFSFTQNGADDHVAAHDLVVTVEALAAKVEIDRALAVATAALSERFDDANYAEQQRLVAMRMRLDGELAAILHPDEA